MSLNTFGFQERMTVQLGNLFESYGYTRYKMNKFEEYDLYARNKDFLLSESVITFTDCGGKLMALKPDVTLSIVKNSRDSLTSLQKLYYNENVYRLDRGGHGFREMNQVGLECIGCVDDLCILEILTLAAQSLKAISNECILDVSHLGILSDILSAIGITGSRQDTALVYIAAKNMHELSAYCRSCGIPEDQIIQLNWLLASGGRPTAVLPGIREFLDGVADTGMTDRLLGIFTALQAAGLEEIFRFDFSAVDDIRYYNGVVFKGFIHGLPESVLSGGQYNPLMRRMHRKSDAIGFAVYVDRLDRLEPVCGQYDVDTVLLYDDTCIMAEVMRCAGDLRRTGIQVMVQRRKPETIRYRQLIKLCGGEVVILENNA